MGSVIITNIGRLVSGTLKEGYLDGDTLLIKDGRICWIGRESAIDLSEATEIIDVHGMTVIPGLIDSHVHPVIGDWTPRQNALGWIEGALHSGVTSMISQGEIHIKGRPVDPAGVKALSILAKKTYDNLRPGGLKLHAGAVILERGLTKEDFQEMSQEGIWLVAEIGVSGLYKPEDVKEMVEWARGCKMKINVHFGGRSVPGSGSMTASEAIQIKPDIVAHVNGGPIGPSFRDVERLAEETPFILEVCINGNPKILHQTVGLMKERNELNRVIIGSDTPTGYGVIPTAIMKTIVQISSINQIPADHAIAMATGNTARAYGLDVGQIQERRCADLVVIDSTSDSGGNEALSSIEAGDFPGIAMTMIDGEIRVMGSRTVLLPVRSVTVKKGSRSDEKV